MILSIRVQRLISMVDSFGDRPNFLLSCSMCIPPFFLRMFYDNPLWTTTGQVQWPLLSKKAAAVLGRFTGVLLAYEMPYGPWFRTEVGV
jgi:hypothetical protein